MNAPYEKIIVKLRFSDDYFTARVSSSFGKLQTKKRVECLDADLTARFWGRDSIQKIQDVLGLTTSEKISLRNGQTLGKYIPQTLMESWVRQRKEARVKREDTVRRIEKVLTALHKLFLKDRRYRRAAQGQVSSDIMPYMDGSTLLWLSVILSAKKDFLRYHDDPDRDEIEDYKTARDFLLDEDYHIDLDLPEQRDKGKGKFVNLRDLLDFCIENCRGRKLDTGLIDPSTEHLRSSLAKAAGDPKLIAKYCREKDLDTAAA